MTIIISAGLVEQILHIDIRWLYIPVAIVALLLIAEIIRVIVRHNKNKGIKNPLDAIDEALELEGSGIDDYVQSEERIFTVDNGKLQMNSTETQISNQKRINADTFAAETAETKSYTDSADEPKEENTKKNENKLVVVKSKKEKDKTIYISDIIFVGKDTELLPKCFESRLKLASEELKKLYSELKNNLLSYEGVYSRTLNSVEVFRKNGVWARLKIKAKSLYLYLNIAPNEVTNLKFKTIENVRGLLGTPIEIKVSGSLKLKKSIELIKTMFENAGINKAADYTFEDYSARYPELKNSIMDNVNVKKLDGRE